MKTLLALFILSSFSVFTTKEIIFHHPVEENETITSGFGMRTHPILQTKRLHNGLDYGVNIGTKVYASALGKVTFAGDLGRYGNTIIIDHGNGLETVYCNLSSFEDQIKEGINVTQDMIIGFSGASGAVNSPHLHFQIVKDGEAVDPVEYLSKD